MSYLSYCHIDKDSAIYLIATGDGWECIACHISPGDNRMFENVEILSPAGLRAHLEQHLEVGQRVPQRVFDRLDREGF